MWKPDKVGRGSKEAIHFFLFLISSELRNFPNQFLTWGQKQPI
jgi:hypothetical protein